MNNYERGQAEALERGVKACMMLMDKLAAAKRDSAEWKEQHENLLAMFRASEERAAKAEAATRSAIEKPSRRAMWIDAFIATCASHSFDRDNIREEAKHIIAGTGVYARGETERHPTDEQSLRSHVEAQQVPTKAGSNAGADDASTSPAPAALRPSIEDMMSLPIPECENADKNVIGLSDSAKAMYWRSLARSLERMLASRSSTEAPPPAIEFDTWWNDQLVGWMIAPRPEFREWAWKAWKAALVSKAMIQPPERFVLSATAVQFEEKPVAWLIVRHSGTGGAAGVHHEVVLTPLTDDTFMDEGDEAWPLYRKCASPDGTTNTNTPKDPKRE